MDIDGSASSLADGAGRLGFPIVGVGASAGGLPALTALLGGLPQRFDAALVIVTHLAADTRSRLAELLAEAGRRPVVELTGDEHPRPGNIYVLPAGHDVVIESGVLGLVPRAQESPHRPIDRFLTSLARDQGAFSVAVILSGAGRDGALGLRDIHAAGGLVLVQKPETALHDGMPGSAVATGLADVVLPAADIGPYLAETLPRLRLGAASGLPDADSPECREALERISALLSAHTGHDVRSYKTSTVLRRLHKRMLLAGVPDLSAYAEKLAADGEECSRLFSDLLIGVTAFFRDTEAFALLAETVAPDIFASLGPGAVLRTWVACCSTGEEAYSVAMLLAEHGQTLGVERPVKIFATDIDAKALETARKGSYPRRLAETMGEGRLQSFCLCTAEACTIAPGLRDDIVFAVHNLLRDPPFLGMDLIVCRNFLIYLNPEAQAKVVSLFTHALRPGGYLLLGPAETIGEAQSFFVTVDKKWRLYRRKAIAAGALDPPYRFLPSPRSEALPSLRRPLTATPDPEGMAEAALLARYAHPAVLVDLEGRVVRLIGDLNPFLELGPGAPSLAVRKLARKPLRLCLRQILDAALADGGEHACGPVVLDGGGEFLFRACPVPDAWGKPAFILLVFERQMALRRIGAEDAAAPPPVAGDTVLVARYEGELERMADQLQRSVGRYETLTEELRASNEELVSMNEELQSSNEEMDASREELQSLNEELTSLNLELQRKVEELAQAQAFVENLLAATNIGTLVLDAALAVVRFTPAVTELFHLIPSDAGRPVEQVKTTFDAGQLADDCRLVLEGGGIVEREVCCVDGRWFLMRAYPFRSPLGAVEGVVLTYSDISTLKQAESVLRRGKAELEAQVARRTEELREKARLLDLATVMVRDLDGRITYWNTGSQRSFGWTRDEAMGRVSYELLGTEFSQPLPEIMERLLRDGHWSGELRKTTKDGRVVELAVSWVLNRDAASRPVSILEVANDVTERNRLGVQALRWSRVFESAEFGLAHVRVHDNAFLEVNRAFARQRGYEPEELIGKPLFMLIPPEERPAVGQAVAGFDVTGHGVVETIHVRKDGSRFPVLIEVTVLRDARGEAVSRVAYALDITERVRAEEALRDMARFPSENPHPVLRISPDLLVVHANPASQDFLAVLGSGPGQLFPEVLRPAAREALASQDMRQTEIAVGERVFAVTINPVPQREYANVYGLDITERIQATQALMRSEERLRQVVDNAPDAIIVQCGGRFVLVNPAAVRLFGADAAEELLGQDIVSHMHPDSRETVRERIRLVNEQRIPLAGMELLYLRRDGTAVAVEAVAAPFEHQGRPASLVFARDITERRRAAEEALRHTALQEAVARIRGAYVSGQAVRTVFETALAELLQNSGSRFGFVAELGEDERGRPVRHWLAVSGCGFDERAVQAAGNGPGSCQDMPATSGLRGCGEVVLTNNPGQDPRPVLRELPRGHPFLEAFLGVPLTHGEECVGLIGLANRPGGYDDSQVAALHPLADACAQIIERLRAERRLVAAKQAAEAASLSKSEFLANMSHEIRTPLNGVLGMLQLLNTTELDGEQSEYVDNAVKSSKRLTRLLSDILDLSLVESGRLVIRQAPCSPTDLRDAVIDLFSLSAREKGITLSVRLDPDLPETILADEVRLRQILFNLAGNAVKFTDAGGVRIDISPASKHFDAAFRVLLTVSDTGIGISDDQLEGIFEPFGQVEGVYVRRFGGAGLGLSIVRRLVALMGGEIAVDSEAGVGTTFCVSVPLARQPAGPARAGAPVSACAGPALRLLLAEDDAVSLMSFARMLQKAGHTVELAENGAEVLARLEAADFDCILMDVQMPVMDGVAATRAIRGNAALGGKAAIPIIAMTAYAMAGDREKFLAAGMDDYVSKPVDIETLTQALARVTAGRNCPG
ncbi:PAS domain S-box protein [Solidesulfovibrio sp.]